jgi:hypothetical protein
MARDKTTDRHRHSESERAQPEGRAARRRSGNGGASRGQETSGWFGGERGNEFGGEGRFRAEGGQGSHFGGEPDSLGESDNHTAWRSERRRKFVEKFDKRRNERAAGGARDGHDGTSIASGPLGTGRKTKK